MRSLKIALALATLSVTVPAASRDRNQGPFDVAMSAQPGLPHHTVYMPADLTALHAARLPVFVWGNGGCADQGNRYSHLLSRIAAHGYLVIALGNIADRSVESAWPSGEPVLPAAPPDANAPADTHATEMTEAIDWAMARNADESSALHDRIDTGKVAVGGHSCGGLQALAISSTDPRITTTLMLGTGVWSTGTGGLPGAPVTKDSLRTVHGSIIYINGDGDIALANAKDDFARLGALTAVRAQREGVLHSGTYWLPGGGAFGTVSLAWLDWQLKGDEQARHWFVGADCCLCVDRRWQIERRNIP